MGRRVRPGEPDCHAGIATIPRSNRTAGQLYNVPAAFLGAVMMAESGGNAAAVGDEEHSVGLF